MWKKETLDTLKLTLAKPWQDEHNSQMLVTPINAKQSKRLGIKTDKAGLEVLVYQDNVPTTGLVAVQIDKKNWTFFEIPCQTPTSKKHWFSKCQEVASFVKTRLIKNEAILSK